MKKIVSIILALTMILNFGVFAYADVNNSNNTIKIKQIIDSKLPKDIKLLTVSELENMGTRGIPGPDGGIRINGPYYKTYENRTDSYIITAITGTLSGGLSSAILAFVKVAVIKNVVTTMVASIVGYHTTLKPMYVGTWTSAAYSDTYDQYIYYATVVHYKYDDYTQPITVQYYEVGRSDKLVY